MNAKRQKSQIVIPMSFSRPLNNILISLADAAIVILAVWLAYLLRFNFSIPPSEIAEMPLVLVSITAIRVLLFAAIRSNLGIIRHEGLTDKFKFVLVLILGSFIFILADFICYYLINQRLFIPLTIIILEFLITTALLLLFRSLVNGGYASFMHRSPTQTNLSRQSQSPKTNRETLGDVESAISPDLTLMITGRLVTGKRILITGAGSNTGREITTLLLRCHPAEIILTDSDITDLEKTEPVNAGYPGVKIMIYHLDPADKKGMEEILTLHDPQLVIHAGMSSLENNLDKARQIILQSGKSLSS